MERHLVGIYTYGYMETHAGYGWIDFLDAKRTRVNETTARGFKTRLLIFQNFTYFPHRGGEFRTYRLFPCFPRKYSEREKELLESGWSGETYAQYPLGSDQPERGEWGKKREKERGVGLFANSSHFTTI